MLNFSYTFELLIALLILLTMDSSTSKLEKLANDSPREQDLWTPEKDHHAQRLLRLEGLR